MTVPTASTAATATAAPGHPVRLVIRAAPEAQPRRRVFGGPHRGLTVISRSGGPTMGGVLGAGAGDGGAGRLRVRLLDGFAVAVDGRAIPAAAWPSRKARQLLKLLALAPGHRVHRDQALEALWPDLTAAGATRALYQTPHLLRRALEPGAPRRAASRYVRLDRDGVALIAPGGVETDLAAFGRAAADALGTGAPADLRAALAFGGEVLPDDRYEEWTLGPRRELREQRLALLAALAAA